MYGYQLKLISFNRVRRTSRLLWGNLRASRNTVWELLIYLIPYMSILYKYIRSYSVTVEVTQFYTSGDEVPPTKRHFDENKYDIIHYYYYCNITLDTIDLYAPSKPWRLSSIRSWSSYCTGTRRRRNWPPTGRCLRRARFAWKCRWWVRRLQIRARTSRPSRTRRGPPTNKRLLQTITRRCYNSI